MTKLILELLALAVVLCLLFMDFSKFEAMHLSKKPKLVSPKEPAKDPKTEDNKKDDTKKEPKEGKVNENKQDAKKEEKKENSMEKPKELLKAEQKQDKPEKKEDKK